MQRIIGYLISTKSSESESARREYILNVLLGGIIITFTPIFLTFLIHYHYLTYLGLPTRGGPPEIVAAFTLSFLALFFFSKAGLHRIVAYIFIGILFLSASYTLVKWGATVPQGLLLLALVIVMSGVLVGTRFAIVSSITCALILFGISYAQINGILVPDTDWLSEPFKYKDIVTYIATLGVITVVSWLFNREIEKALKRARGSEKNLKNERDMLEIKVDERTKELNRVQLEKVQHLYHLADFGRMAAGFFHDLVNPLTVVSLNLERLQTKGFGARQGQVHGNAKRLLGRAVDGTKRMEGFVKAVRRQIQQQETKTYFALNKEILRVMEIVEHRAKELRVSLSFVSSKKIQTYGNPLRFHQLVCNIVLNAIDAYEKVKRRKNRKIIIKLSKKNNQAVLTIQDFGCGVAKRKLAKIFDPFFTTKSVEKGTGIGLSICEDIVEKEFGGKIKVKSKKDKGTTFTVKFPVRKRI